MKKFKDILSSKPVWHVPWNGFRLFANKHVFAQFGDGKDETAFCAIASSAKDLSVAVAIRSALTLRIDVIEGQVLFSPAAQAVRRVSVVDEYLYSWWYSAHDS
jgi:hypothetical protein